VDGRSSPPPPLISNRIGLYSRDLSPLGLIFSFGLEGVYRESLEFLSVPGPPTGFDA